MGSCQPFSVSSEPFLRPRTSSRWASELLPNLFWASEPFLGPRAFSGPFVGFCSAIPTKGREQAQKRPGLENWGEAQKPKKAQAKKNWAQKNPKRGPKPNRGWEKFQKTRKSPEEARGPKMLSQES